MALLLAYAVKALFTRLSAAHERDIARQEQALQRETARADKAEEQLTALNESVRREVVPTLTRANDVLVKATELLSEQRRER